MIKVVFVSYRDGERDRLTANVIQVGNGVITLIHHDEGSSWQGETVIPFDYIKKILIMGEERRD